MDSCCSQKILSSNSKFSVQSDWTKCWLVVRLLKQQYFGLDSSFPPKCTKWSGRYVVVSFLNTVCKCVCARVCSIFLTSCSFRAAAVSAKWTKMALYRLYVKWVAQWKTMPLPLTFLASYLLDESLKSQGVLGLIPGCHFLFFNIITFSQSRLSLAQSRHSALAAKQFFEGRLKENETIFYFFYIVFSAPSTRCRISGGLGLSPGLGHAVLDQLHHLYHHPAHGRPEPLGRRWQTHGGHYVRGRPPPSLCLGWVPGVKAITLFHLIIPSSSMTLPIILHGWVYCEYCSYFFEVINIYYTLVAHMHFTLFISKSAHGYDLQQPIKKV